MSVADAITAVVHALVPKSVEDIQLYDELVQRSRDILNR
jgi:hypothetical protein